MAEDVGNLLFEIFMELLGGADVSSDFIYYNSIKDNKDIDKDTRKAVFVFSIIGAIVFGEEILFKIMTWKKTEDDENYWMKCIGYATGLMEDFPMLIILLKIRQQTGEEFNTEGKVSFWLAVISMFLKLYNTFYYSYKSENGDKENDDIETKRIKAKKQGRRYAIAFTAIVIILFFALHPALWN